MKTFVLALSLLAPDGAKTEIPVDVWTFRTMAECVKSSTYLNRNNSASSRNYTCVEYDPSLNVAAARSVPAPAAPKRNS